MSRKKMLSLNLRNHNATRRDRQRHVDGAADAKTKKSFAQHKLHFRLFMSD